ncbi:alpha-amylase family glycosyl hydrolase, partial [Streptomyces pharetrae]|uniref:alpha-amylase family glycosyl hydrolase n=1 Tax=Streptomyces pharetrae TaxID=291370 RepID=UPI0036BE432E
MLTALPPATPPADAAPPRPPSDRALARTPARPAPSREQFYLALPDRFANGSTANDQGGLTGDRSVTGHDPSDKRFYQGGDLRGLIEKLDYIKGLGTTAIWMAPVFKNKPVQTVGGTETAGYHGYAITDFTRVDPHFGTNAELAELVDKAHAKGMKVFFDVITNHTADTIDYAEKEYRYRSKGAYPYLDSEGRPFDDSTGMAQVDEGSLPYTPRNRTGEHDTKVPAWLNDPTMYHNRGDSTFAGESALYGDFIGNDDLWTERPEVVEGMERIYETWVKDFGIDGFRVDTAKNVNMSFWTQWASALDAYAARQGKPDFFIFAEAFSADPTVMAPYLVEGRLDGTLDFPLQAALRNYASRGGPTRDLAHVLAQDYRYTTDKANAYGEVTFLGSHDMGRIGSFVSQDNPGADDAELLRRDRFAHELLFLSRGNP